MNPQPTPFLNRAAIKKGKRIIVAAVGGTVLAVGFALVVLPGPAFLVIPAGLAILAMEFAWARRWLRKAKGFLPGKNSRKKQETPSSSSQPTNYHRDRVTASCRNAIPSTQTEKPSQPKSHY
jgi:hypothetical protein